MWVGLWIWAVAQVLLGFAGTVFFLVGVRMCIEESLGWLALGLLAVSFVFAGWLVNGVDLMDCLSQLSQLGGALP